MKSARTAGGLRFQVYSSDFVLWKNAITTLMLTQAAFSKFAVLALIPTSVVMTRLFTGYLITNAVLCAILAQIKRDGLQPPKRGDINNGYPQPLLLLDRNTVLPILNRCAQERRIWRCTAWIKSNVPHFVTWAGLAYAFIKHIL